MSELNWFKSSFSEASGNACVEIAVADDERIAIRHSVYPARGFTVARAAFAAFVSTVRAEELDHPTPQGPGVCPDRLGLG